MPSRVTQSSFTRGELSPRLDARTQLEQYAIGLKSAKNAIIHQEGGISNRMGLEFCGEVKKSSKITRVMKFVFNSEQTYMLEFGDKYIRFIKDGGYIVLHSADAWVTSHSYKVGNFVLKDSKIYYCISAHTSGTFATDLQNKKWIEQDIYEIPTPYAAEDLMRIKRSQSGDYLTLTHPNYPPKNLVRNSHYNWSLEDIVFESSINAPTGVTATFSASTPTSKKKTYKYVVTAVKTGDNEESKRSDEVSCVAHREASWTVDEYITIAWTAVTGATEYNVYKQVNGLFGYIGTAAGTSFVDDNIEPDLSSCAPVVNNPFKDNNNPSCSGYFQQRKMYANSDNNPQTLWASQTGAPNNFNTSRPLVATDAVTLSMDDREMNEIRHLVPMKDLIVLTSNSEWKVNGTDGVFQANPIPAAVIQSCNGASHVEPVVSGNMVIFVQSGGSVIRDLGYEYMSEGYDGDELSIFSNHLFEGKEVVDMAYAKEPYRLLWVVFNDGTCASMTYNKKQKLCGWTRVETDGKFEAVDVVREGLEDVAYFVIKRTIDLPYIDGGNLDDSNNYYDAGDLTDMYSDSIDSGDLSLLKEVRYVERTMSRIVNDAKKAFLVDSGLADTFNNPKTHITGLDHLEGKTVICNINGGIIEGLKVENGEINLPIPAKTVVIGLPYEFELETMNIEGENTQGLKKIINQASVKIFNSREDFLFCGADGREFRNPRCLDSVNNSGKLFSNDINSVLTAIPETNASVKIKQNYPLPLTVLSLSAIVDVADNENN